MAVSINKIYNGNVYINGNSKLGQIDELELPVVKPKTSDHKPMGLVSEFELPTGFEKMEAKIKWNSFYPDAMVTMADSTSMVKLQFRGNLESWVTEGKTDEVPYVVFMNGLPKDFPTGNFKAQENAEFESTVNITYLRIEVDGRQILEFDPMNSIYKIDGVDKLQNYRNNLGI